MTDQNQSKAVGRREFLFSVVRLSGQITIANSAIYTISMVTSKGPFGGLTAGAKCLDICGNEMPAGTVLGACNIFEGGPQVINQQYKCSPALLLWQQKNPGPLPQIGWCPPGPC